MEQADDSSMREIEAEDHDKIGYGAPTAAEDAEMGHDTSQPGNAVDDGLKILLRNAIEELGPPRDVYVGVFDLPVTTRKWEHDRAVGSLTLSKLQLLADTFFARLDLDKLLNKVASVSPVPGHTSSQRI